MTTKTFPVLNKLTSSGKLQTWTISVEEPSDIVVEFGQKGGKLQRSVERINAGKNIGKVNETSPWEQACSEAESRWTAKQDKAYRPEGESLESAKDQLPMLAQSYDKHSKKIKFPAYVNPKLDGARCTTTTRVGKTILLTRKGKEFTAVPHINEQVASLQLVEGMCLDGELYTHGDSFQDIISKIKRDDIHADSKSVDYHIYDLFSPASAEGWTYEERWQKLQKLDLSKTPNLKLVEAVEVKNHEELLAYHETSVLAGFEGCMVRNKLGIYAQDKRSYDLQKVKTFQTEEFEIVGAEQNRGRQAGQCSLLCKTKDGSIFAVKPEGNEAQREWYWDHCEEIKGKMLTVRFFEYSKDDIPRFPIGQEVIGVGIRDYE